MSIMFAIFVGLAVGCHIATWGMYKDSIHEGFTMRRYRRSVLVGVVLAPAAATVVGLDASTAVGQCSSLDLPMHWSERPRNSGRHSFEMKISRNTSSPCSFTSWDG